MNTYEKKYGGLIRQKKGGHWPPQKCYGTVKNYFAP